MEDLKHYLKADIRRVTSGYSLFISALLICALLYLGIFNQTSSITSVLDAFIRTILERTIIVIFICCAYPFSCSFIEDLETNYARYEMVRGDTRYYILSKLIVNFMAAVFVMVFGVVIFTVSLLWFVPIGDAVCFSDMSVQFKGIFNQRLVMLWFIIWGVKKGILAGILSLLAMLVSLCCSNKILVMSVPALAYEMLLEIEAAFDAYDISVYDSSWFAIEVSSGNIITDIRGVIFVVLCVVCITELIFRKFKRRI